MGQTVGERSHAIVKALRRCGHFLYYKMGDKGGQRRIFYVLLTESEVLQRELQDRLGLQSGSLSEIVNRMESEGLLQRGRSREDGRNVVLRLTQKGRQQAMRSVKQWNEQVEQMMSCLDESRQQALLDSLEALLTHWETLEKTMAFSGAET